MDGNGDAPTDRLRRSATEVATTVVTGVWLGALFTGQEWWLGALLVGYLVVVPLVELLFGDEGERKGRWSDWNDTGWGASAGESHEAEPRTAAEESEETPLATLRRRYAAGELTDEQFERKVERLLETETLEDVEEVSARERDRER